MAPSFKEKNSSKPSNSKRSRIMPFRLHNESRKWFKDIQRRLGSAPLFDMYYFCLLAGLSENRLAAETKDTETSELVDNFPGEYLSRGRLIIALFIKRELRRQGIQLSERPAVNRAIGRLVDPNSSCRLRLEGM